MLTLPYDEYLRLDSDVVISESGYPELREEWDYRSEVEEGFLDESELQQRQAQLIGVPPSQFVEFAIRVPNKELQKHVPFSFDGRRYLRLPYDTPARRTLYKCGRQVEKSTLLGNKCLAYCCIVNAFNVLYVSPTNQQTKKFSADRLKEPIETSEILKAWTTSKLSDNVFEKQFINRSKITLRYAYHNADRTRGIPADLILVDEIQDVITDNIPVIEECASHSHYKLFLYSGTPKSTDNTIEHYWQNFSTQNEWVVPCDRHGTPNNPSSWFWNILTEDNIDPGQDGPICSKCKQRIDPMHPMAQWASMNEGVKQKLKEFYEGYRIPQLMVPWIPWSEILDKYVKFPRATFYNEVLGLSYDSGSRPLTRKNIIDNCVPGQYMDQDGLHAIKAALGDISPVYAGIDWGTGEGSYSVIALGAYIHGFFNIFYIHRFEGPEVEPSAQIDLISKLIKYWNVQLVGVDYGGGHYPNDQLARTFGSRRIVKYQYSQPSQKVRWEDGLRRYLVHRTEVMSDIFSAIKRLDVFRFPDFAQFEDPFAKDMLNIFSEYNETQRQVQYKHAPDMTDDSFHAILFCFLASMIRNPRHDVLNPTQKTNYAAPEDT
jgi:hypothetical protein